MDRLTQTARIVAASLKNNPHTKPDELQDLIRTIHAALPAVIAAEQKPAMVAPAPTPEQPEPEANDDVADDGQQQPALEASDEDGDRDPPRPKMGFSEALAASRARFSGSQEDRVASAAAGTAAARDAVMASHTAGEPQPDSDAEAEAEVEAHAS